MLGVWGEGRGEGEGGGEGGGGMEYRDFLGRYYKSSFYATVNIRYVQ